ncbi:MAG: hypothetical protein DMG85_00580 [Acidobacteria bacterium]|nr:MAG: hypothetical protein DMG85_00580 [Acidobacteriota bacterium]
MAYSPIVPPPAGALREKRFMPPGTPARAEPIDTEVGATFSYLRELIASSTAERDTVLRAIAEAAQDLTLASGTALAMQRDGQIVCLGRSGETAPALGARLSIDSGISGECLRTGKMLRCDDTEKDQRVDPEVCRKMRLRSVAAVPLFGRHGTIGVLEAFSTRSFAFAEEHMDYLARLAELAEAAQSRQSSATVAEVERPKTRSRLVAFLKSPLPTRNSAVLHLRERLQAKNRRYWAVAATAVLLLVSVIVWRVWSKPLSAAIAGQQVVQAEKRTGLRSASAVKQGLAVRARCNARCGFRHGNFHSVAHENPKSDGCRYRQASGDDGSRQLHSRAAATLCLQTGWSEDRNAALGSGYTAKVCNANIPRRKRRNSRTSSDSDLSPAGPFAAT